MEHQTKTTRYAKRLGKTIRAIRLNLDWTLDDLAAKSATDKGHLSRIENGLLEPPPRRLRLIAKALGVSAVELQARAQ